MVYRVCFKVLTMIHTPPIPPHRTPAQTGRMSAEYVAKGKLFSPNFSNRSITIGQIGITSCWRYPPNSPPRTPALMERTSAEYVAKGKLFSLKVSVRSIPIGQIGMIQKLLVRYNLPSLITGLFSLKVSVRSIPIRKIGMSLMRIFSL